MAAKKATRRRRTKVEPKSRGLAPRDVASGAPTAAAKRLAEQVEEDGGAVIGSYRDPLGSSWQLIVALPIDKVAPTPFQCDVSAAHLKRLTQRIEELGRFLDPIIVVRRDDGTYWTPNGSHRLHAMKELGAVSIVALLVPEASTAYQILALNTEKAHNLREKALEVIRMARDLAGSGDTTERDHAAQFEDPALITLGLCYEANARFSGGAYHPVLKRTEEFFAAKLPKALETRIERARKLIELDEAVAAAVLKLKERGFESPYLKSFVVARVNPIRFLRDATADFDETIDKMTSAARRFDVSKIKADQIARSGGAPEAPE